jgi:prepilin-type N-terminal cleavage/methylation domain-containing protein/prepilin-type processing-associated H-X9-DG protein
MKPWRRCVAGGVSSRRAKDGFTLIELLVVAAVISILAAMVVPLLGNARAKARAAICANTMHQLGLALNMYADDNQDWLPCPEDEYGDAACWYYAINPYILRTKTTAAQVDAANRMDLYKQDPVWTRFTGDAATNGRSIKMNRKLLGRKGAWNITSNVTNAVPSFRHRNEIVRAATTPLLFDGVVETVASINDWRRFDGWEPKVALRHSGGANILFVDGHVILWKKGTPNATSPDGWASDTTGLTWWVDE